MASSRRPQLGALAARLGVESGYASALERRVVSTSDATREALVAAMGWDGSSEQAAASALAQLGAPDPPAAARRAPCLSYRERLGETRCFGLWANLYSVRSQRNWGFGNLGDLRELLGFAARHGGAFVGVNPLHALTHRDDGLCPYSPVTRLFQDPLYLEVERVAELPATPEAQAPLAAATRAAATLRDARELAPRAVEEALYSVLRPVHARFGQGHASARRLRAYRRFQTERGAALHAFATFQALADELEPTTGARDWRSWPGEYRDPQSPAVRAFAERHRAAVDFHVWLQFELDSQVQRVAAEAARTGMALGLYTDLALGSSAGGFDTWSHPQLFAQGATVGAPPDAFAPAGQDWGFPPLDPHALRRDGFGFWRRALEANLRGAGALRVDHALGLRRLFWIPAGAPPSAGAYVRFPEADLLAVLGETSQRCGAIVIGEDLGTVPEGFSEAMRGHGLLSSRVLLFERDRRGFRESAAWLEACLATANTHDLPPLAGWLADADLTLRLEAGQIPDPATLDAIRAARRADRTALAKRLAAEGDLPADATEDDLAAWQIAVTRFLCRTPAVAIGLSLDDLAGERVPINLPGVPPERHRSWARRMERPLEELLADPRVRRILDAVPAERRALR